MARDSFTLRDRRTMHDLKERQHGFTLIELMITVAIVAILAAVAYPAYTKYVQRGYRSEGIAMLNDAAARAERFYAQNNTYAGTTLASLGLVTDTKITTLSSASSKYQLTVVSATATTYKFQVAPQGSQTSDACGTLTLAQDGTKTSTAGIDCFK
jgi:type IV pilus assembly protein PilE